MERPVWNRYFLDLLPGIAKRSTCLRRQLGAIITRDNRIIGTGYNGPPHGSLHCKVCVKDQKDIPSGQGQNECPAAHAELNAIASCAKYTGGTEGATIYISVSPCAYCAKLIIGAGIQNVVFLKAYPDSLAFELLNNANVGIYEVTNESSV